MKQFKPSIIAACIVIMAACNNPSPNPATTADSARTAPVVFNDTAGLTATIRSMYEWHEGDWYVKPDFTPVKLNPKDSAYKGLNWPEQNTHIKRLAESGYFSTEFIKTYHDMGKRVDTELSSGKTEWLAGDEGPYSQGADPWCACQDTGNDDFWNTMAFSPVTFNNGEATLTWTNMGTSPYTIKARKEKDQWKITSMAGFTDAFYFAQDTAR